MSMSVLMVWLKFYEDHLHCILLLLCQHLNKGLSMFQNGQKWHWWLSASSLNCLLLFMTNFLLLVFRVLMSCSLSRMKVFMLKVNYCLVSLALFVMLRNAGKTIVLGIDWTVTTMFEVAVLSFNICVSRISMLHFEWQFFLHYVDISAKKITCMLVETPSYFRGNLRTCIIKLKVQWVFLIKIEPLLTKVCLDNQKCRLNWTKVQRMGWQLASIQFDNLKIIYTST